MAMGTEETEEDGPAVDAPPSVGGKLKTSHGPVTHTLFPIGEYTSSMAAPKNKGYLATTRRAIEAPKPLKRRDVLLPCPVQGCKSGPIPWTCFDCDEALEYGFSDERLHCECGTRDLADCRFKCHIDNAFKSVKKKRLTSLLEQLEPYPELNVLILVETGVGKSTFINAFANYLAFPTMDKALVGDLITLIPNKFCMTDENLKDHCIQNGGVTADEDFGPGQSATQGTKVHRFVIGETVLRIIDTPGVGDVRGALKDNENFKNILDTIGSLDVIHGIIILLKPNETRLTVTFCYCIEELLVHLHKSAINNMIFGFTNTRGTNFRPGNTMPTLREHLAQKAPDITCSRENVYCFDSEGYRFLAALQNGINFHEDIMDSYGKSWDYSVKETERLIGHIKSLSPHFTKQTLSLNNARQLILQLTKPMAEITRTIVKNVENSQRNEERIKDLNDDDSNLMKDLMVDKIDLIPKELGHPRTVCTNSTCVQVSDIVGHKQTNYITWCHEHCYLKNVTVEMTNNPDLIHCAAMGGTHTCRHCNHNYGEHMHITYELLEKKVKVGNKAIKKLIAENASFRDVKAAQIAQLQKSIQEYKDEHVQIEKIAAKFGAFLKHNAITYYNDARLEYLQFIIGEEGKKAPDSKDEQLLQALKDAKDVYQEQLAIIEKAIQDGQTEDIKDPASIERMISQLYGMKHFGKSLERIMKVAVKSSEKCYNEQSHRFKRWSGTRLFSMLKGEPLQIEKKEKTTLVGLLKQLGLSF